MINNLDPKEWLELNAKLQARKNALRKALKERGILQKDKTNTFDKYSYFSEAAYKQLFTELFANYGLELTANEVEYSMFETTSEKMPNGRKVTFEFILSDCSTGFYEKSLISGEGMDKGDKGGFKADTGALKYYLANTFMVATGDDAENESPAAKGYEKATQAQIDLLKRNYQGENLQRLLSANNINNIEDISKAKAKEIIDKLMKTIKAREGNKNENN